MKKNMLIRILSVVCVLACLLAFASCHDELATKEEVGTVENNAKTSLEEAKTTLNAAIDAVKETADAAATKAALEEAKALLETVKGTADAAATQTALDAAIATLNEVKAVAEAAATKEALDSAVTELTALKEAAATKAELEDAVEDLEAKIEAAGGAATEADTALKTELEGKITALDTKIAEGIGANLTTLTTKVNEFETAVNGQIETINGQITEVKAAIAALQDVLGSVEGTEAGDLLARVAALEASVAAIDVDAFKNEYLAVNKILLDSTNEKSFAAFFAKINTVVDDGGYDDDSVVTYQRRVEEIKFALSRAVTLADIDKAFADLEEAENGLVLLADALHAQLQAITVIDLSKEVTDKIAAVEETYGKMVKKNITIDTNDKNDYDLKTGAYTTLKGFATDRGAAINNKIHPMYSANKVLLSKESDILEAKTLIEKLITENVLAVKVEYFALYTSEIYADIYAAALEVAIADLVKNAKETYVANGLTAEAEDLKNAWIEAEIDAKLEADNTLSDAAVRPEVEAAANDPAKLAEFAQQAVANKDAALKAEAEAKHDEFVENVTAAAKVIAKANADMEAATQVADKLYNKAEYVAVYTRYTLLLAAKADAEVEDGLKSDIESIAKSWNSNSYPLYNNTFIASVVAAREAWIANADYKSDADFGTFTACQGNIESENVNYILGSENLDRLNKSDKYVKDMAKVYADNKVDELLAAINAAVNGDVDVDNANIDVLIKKVADLDKAIKNVANYPKLDNDNDGYGDGDNNPYTMVSLELRERLDVINDAYDDVVAALNDLKSKIKYENDAWIIENINAGTDISNFKAALDAIYAEVMADSTDDNKITSVISTLAETELMAANAAFEKFAEKAIDAYIKADETINAIDAAVAANGKLTLDLGNDIYEAITGINSAIMSQIKGLNLNTYFNIPKYDADGNIDHYDYVQFRAHYDRLYAYNNQYKEIAAEAAGVAAELTIAINAIQNYNATKLNTYNEIIALMARFNEEWVEEYFVGMSAKEAVAATDTVNKVGGGTYAFVTNATFAILDDLNTDALATYAAAEKDAADWIAKAQALYANGYTFHDWAREGGFKAVQAEYVALVGKYYTELKADTTPGFGLYAEHEDNFIGHHNECSRMATEATGKIEEIVDLIKALTKVESIGDYAAERVKLNNIKDKLDKFKAGYCADAETDGDFVIENVDYIFNYTKVEAFVAMYELVSPLIGTEGITSGEIIDADEIETHMASFADTLNDATLVKIVDDIWFAFDTARSYYFVD